MGREDKMCISRAELAMPKDFLFVITIETIHNHFMLLCSMKQYCSDYPKFIVDLFQNMI